MGLIQRIFGREPERRSQPTSWDLLRADAWPSESGSPVSPYIAENLSACFCLRSNHCGNGCAHSPLCVYRKEGDGKTEFPTHPVALLFQPRTK